MLESIDVLINMQETNTHISSFLTLARDSSELDNLITLYSNIVMSKKLKFTPIQCDFVQVFNNIDTTRVIYNFFQSPLCSNTTT